jgi:hypothetical protein
MNITHTRNALGQTHIPRPRSRRAHCRCGRAYDCGHRAFAREGMSAEAVAERTAMSIETVKQIAKGGV